MKKIMIAAAAVLLCTSCFHVNKNYKQGDAGDFVEGFQEGFSEGRKASRKPIKGEGAVVNKSFDLKDFDQIVINGHADVSFTQSDAYEVTVRTQENILEWLDYKVEGTTLIIEAKDKREIRAEKYDLVIQAPALKKLVVNGASDFNVGGLRSEEGLDIEINGAGDMDFDRIQCNSLSLEVNGAAEANLTSISGREGDRQCPERLLLCERCRRHRRHWSQGRGRGIEAYFWPGQHQVINQLVS